MYINSITGFETSVRENTVAMRLDDVFYGTQHGIDFSNTMSGANMPQQFKCADNLVAGTVTSSMEALYFNSLNFGLESPMITCNKAMTSYQGFVFSGPNTPTPAINGTQWLGNEMESLNRGMVLTTTAIIGAQGHSLLGMGNIWEGNTWSLTGDLNTFTQFSDAGLSPLFCAPQSSLNPGFNWGNPSPDSYAGTGKTPTIVPSGANFSCTDPSAKSSTFEITYKDLSEDGWGLVYGGLYRFLRYNDSITGANIDLGNFYSSNAGSNLDYLAQVEEYLYQGDYSSAFSTLSGISPANNIEVNTKQFYGLFANHLHDLANNDPFSSSDSLDLINLATMCPEESGSCIYQARALYENIYLQVPFYPGCNTGTGARPATITKFRIHDNESDQLRLVPNPNDGTFVIEAKGNLTSASFSIFDNTGKLIKKFATNFEKGKIELKLDLLPGMYQIMVLAPDGACNSLRLLVAK